MKARPTVRMEDGRGSNLMPSALQTEREKNLPICKKKKLVFCLFVCSVFFFRNIF